MADTQLRFKLSSVFAGEGFAAANTAVKKAGTTASQANGIFGKLIDAVGGSDNKAASFTRTIGGVISGFKTLGIVGGTVSAALTAVDFVVDKSIQHYEDLKKKSAEAIDEIIAKTKKLTTATIDGLHAALEKVGKQADADAKSLDIMTAAANRVNAAMGRRAGAQEEASVVQLKLDNLNKVIAAENDNAAALAKAEGDLAVAVLERKNAMSAHARTVETAQKAEDEANAKVTRARQNLDDATQALAKARHAARILEKAKAVNDAEVSKQREDALKSVTEAENLLRRRQDELTTAIGAAEEAHVNAETETIKLKSAETSYTQKVAEAEKALSDLKDAQAESARKEAINDEIKSNAAEQDKVSAEIQANVAQQAQARADAEAAKASIREDYANRRDAAMLKLAQAEAASAQWEEEKAKQDKINYTDLQRRNLENIRRIYEQSHHAISDKQRQELEAYQEWLKYQDANPEKIVVESLKAEIDMLDDEMKRDLATVEGNTKKTVEELKTVETNTKKSLDELKKIAKDLRESLTIH